MRPRPFETRVELRANRSCTGLQPPVTGAGRSIGGVRTPDPDAIAAKREFFAAIAEANADARCREPGERAILGTIGLQIRPRYAKAYGDAARRKRAQQRIERRSEAERFAGNLDSFAAMRGRQ